MEVPATPPSLAARVRDALARGGGDRRAALVVAVLLVAGPALTLGGAEVLADRMRAEAQRLAAQAGLRAAPRATLAPLLRRAGVAATLEALARALPAEATVVRAEGRRDGGLSIDVLAPDPDRLRGALRREPILAGLGEAGQRAGDGGMVVTLETGR